jgi:hypothetical protein
MAEKVGVAFDRWRPTKERVRGAATALGFYVLAVAVFAVAVRVADGEGTADGFAFVVGLGVAVAAGWIVLGLLFNLCAVRDTR